jgi:hypothetical protein
MPQSYDPTPNAETRQRVRDQLLALREASNGNVAWDTEDPADHNFLFVPGRVLMTEDVESVFLETLDERPELPNREDAAREDRTNITTGLVSYSLPAFSGSAVRDVRLVVDAVAQRLGRRGAVTPEHYVHVAPNGSGNSCPATEPAETGLTAPWPPKVSGDGTGEGVKVAVVDCGFVDLQTPAGASRVLEEYDGHGPFAAAVIRTQAPDVVDPIIPIDWTTLNVTNPNSLAGIVAEGDLAGGLEQALRSEVVPDIISMSAGCHTYDHLPLVAFEQLWSGTMADMDTVLVAAAGNECTDNPFYPAASWWATGVGSLDHFADRVSDYSNYGVSANVFLLGRNHVNEFPDGYYRCRWTPDVDDVRLFKTGLARWSGTSFATPLLAGYLAAYISAERANGSTRTVRELHDDFLASPTVRWAWHAEWDTYYRYISSQGYPTINP